MKGERGNEVDVWLEKVLARPVAERTKDLLLIRELLEAGTLAPVIDRSYPLEQTAEAHRYVDGGHKRGNVVITFGQHGLA